MQPWIASLSRLRRRVLGRYVLDDPRPVKLLGPYTYFLPSAEEAEALEAGDQAQLVFRSIPPSRKWDAERMWVKVVSKAPAGLVGELLSIPDDMPQLHEGAAIPFQPYHVISILWADPGHPRVPPEPKRQYWERCLVDDCVLYGDVPVGYVYRDEPETAEDADYPDSGWCIRGDLRDQSPEQLAERKVSYVALGAVLNRDDSWLHLIDEPVGSAFDRNFETGEFLPRSD